MGEDHVEGCARSDGVGHYVAVVSDPLVLILVRSFMRSGRRFYQQSCDGFSTSQAISGSASIFEASTVALYAAKPGRYGGLSLSPSIAFRAGDLIPSPYQQTCDIQKDREPTFSSNNKIRLIHATILKRN